MRTNLIRCRSSIALALAVLTSLSIETEAHAAMPCSFDAGTLTVEGVGAFMTLERIGTDIGLSGEACPGATVYSTDTINFVAEPDAIFLTIDLSGGPFAPGATDEGDGSSEIEINLSSTDATPKSLLLDGSSGPDHLAIDGEHNAVNLNADESVPDVDLTLDTTWGFDRIDTKSGDDIIATTRVSADVVGGDGDDVFSSSDDSHEHGMDGQGGYDRVSFAATSTPIQVQQDDHVIRPSVGGAVVVSLVRIESIEATPWNDEITVTPGDEVAGSGGDDVFKVHSGTHEVIGGPGDDGLEFIHSHSLVVHLADGVANSEVSRTTFSGLESIAGTGSYDRFVAGNRDYVLLAGYGTDTYSVAAADHGTEVSLADHSSSTGDRLRGFESVVGSAFRDRLVGSADVNVLRGGDGNDELRGLQAPDRLFGDAGDDRLDGGAGGDRCRGGGGGDVLTAC